MKKKHLSYDIETLPIGADIFSLGKQIVRHQNLQPNRQFTQIICIQYSIDFGPVKILKRNPEDIWDQGTMIEQFDKIVKQSDVVIGKNSDRFDNRHINTIRLLSDIEAMPDWIQYTDDLQKQFKKHFHLPSYAQDYISDLLGFGGKGKVEWDDWKNINNYFKLLEFSQYSNTRISDKILEDYCQYHFKKSLKQTIKEGKVSLSNMYKYGKKDTEDLNNIWKKAEKHFIPKHPINTPENSCNRCGSKDIIPDRFLANGLVSFHCNSCNKYAGRARQLVNGGFGKILKS